MDILGQYNTLHGAILGQMMMLMVDEGKGRWKSGGKRSSQSVASQCLRKYSV